MMWKPLVGFKLILGRNNGDRAVRVFREFPLELENLKAARRAGLMAIDALRLADWYASQRYGRTAARWLRRYAYRIWPPLAPRSWWRRWTGR